MKEIAESIAKLESDKAIEFVKNAIAQGKDPVEITNKGIVAGIKIIGDLFEKEEYFLPELIMGADIAKECIEILVPYMPSKKEGNKKILFASVQGDLHDLGKNLVALMCEMAGFVVIDLGIDVPSTTIIAKAIENKVNVIALSALMVTTMPVQREVIAYLEDAGIRSQYKVIIGGAPTTQDWANKIKADGWAEDAARAVKVIEGLIS